ncbi:hypothetical protein M433DRAFT_161406 [Acidomyces richmondensis BFW]|nr:hypothetical protein M433DRAFT_161406 [Acidomyces richmondensis BFW]
MTMREGGLPQPTIWCCCPDQISLIVFLTIVELFIILYWLIVPLFSHFGYFAQAPHQRASRSRSQQEQS